jgi:predicted RNA-binding Zn ribbon-like protein
MADVAPSRRPAAVPDEELDIARTLALVNTLYPRPLSSAEERIGTYEALVSWAREQQAIPAATADRLMADARRHPQQAAAAAARVRELREAVHGVLIAIEAGRTPPAAPLETISHWVAAACVHGRLVPHDGQLHWMAGKDEALDRIGWELARSAGRILTSPRLTRLRACAAEDCGWVFEDETRNRSRRWCDMKTCGNRAKVRRFRAREA